MAVVAFSLNDAEEYSLVRVVNDYHFVLLLSLYCVFALKYLCLACYSILTTHKVHYNSCLVINTDKILLNIYLL